MTDTIATQTLSFAGARRALDTSLATAEQIGIAVCITVTDPSGQAIIAARMDGAPRLCADISANKAYSVSSFGGRPTHTWWPAIADDPALVHGLTQTPRLIVFAGGVPVISDGTVVGAIGVSGGSAEQDRQIAEAGAATIG